MYGALLAIGPTLVNGWFAIFLEENEQCLF